MFAVFSRVLGDVQKLFAGDRGLVFSGDDADFQHLRRAVAERDAQARRENQREDEDPQQRFRLAKEFAEADDGELDEGAVASFHDLLVPQMPSRQGDEDIFQSCGMRAKLGERRALTAELGE